MAPLPPPLATGLKYMYSYFSYAYQFSYIHGHDYILYRSLYLEAKIGDFDIMAHICHLRLKNLCLSNFILVRTYSTSEIFTFVSTCTLFYICLVHLYMSCTFRSEQSSCSGWRTARRCMFSNSNGVGMCRTKVIESVRFCCNL